MLTFNQEMCTACGLCVKICHQHCLFLDEGLLTIDCELCSTCTQCIAVCPTRAFSWDGIPPAGFDRSRLPEPGQMDELFKERRTVRAFKDGKIERALVEEIAATAVYAPTHNFQLRAVAVDDDDTLRLADEVILNFAGRIYRLFFKPAVFAAFMRRLPAPYAAEYVRARPKLESCLNAGSALGSLPAALIFLVGDRRTPLSAESAQYALYNMVLYAQVKGLGSRILVGNQMSLNRSGRLRRRLGLARHEGIFGTLGLGFPAVRFRNSVKGRRLKFSWAGGRP